VFPRRVLLSFAAVIAAASVSVWAVVSVADAELRVVAHGPVLRANPNTGPFEGLGAWIDIFDKTSWRHPGATVADLGAHGVRTLYLQTSNDFQKRSIVKSKGVIAFLDSAHSAGMKVVAWYLPGFVDTGLDLGRVEAAISLRTPAGNGFDGFGLDIESPKVADPMLRTARLLQLSDQIRAFAGDGYPLGAIIPSPHGMTVHAGYWPNFPYQELALRYDAFLPMAYFTWRDKSTIGAAGYIAANLQILRAAVGSDEVPVHIIGGIAQDSALAGVQGFARAVRLGGVIGDSLYSYPGVTQAMWAALSQAVSPSPSASTSPPGVPQTTGAP
jgi:hypothetical protein